MSMRVSRPVAIALAVALAACGCPEPVPPSEGAEPLMAALRDGRFEDATALLSGAALQAHGGATGFDIWIESERLRPKSWVWGTPTFRSELERGGPDRRTRNWVELDARVEFLEGPPGRANVQLEALGCKANPWRFVGFTLARDPA
jgi:hypothetical protein